MEAKHVKDLMEAYSSIYEEKEESEMEAGEKEKKDEGGKHKEGKHPKGKEEKGEKEDKEDEKGMKESADLFDYLLEYLVAEGYADTNKAALAIMANMSEEWKQSIVEGESGRTAVGNGRTVGPLGGAIRAVFSGNLPAGKVNIQTRQTGPNRPPAVPASKDDSGKLTDFGAGGGKAKLKTGMSVGQVERQGRMNKGDYSG
jgi:hypothetical protein